MEIEQELLERVFAAALERGGSFAEVYAEKTESESLQLMDGQVSQATLSMLSGVGVRVVCGEKTGYSYVMSREPADLLRAARSAACIADSAMASGMRNNAMNSSLSGMADGTMDAGLSGTGNGGMAGCKALSTPTFYPILMPWTDYAVTRRAEYLKRMEAAVLELDERVVKVRASLTIDHSDIQIANNLGVNVHDVRPLVSLRLSVVLQQEGRTESGFASRQLRQGAEFLDDALMLTLAREAVGQAVHLFLAIRPEGGEMPVVMAAGASGILLHEAIGHAFEADFNRQNTSIFSGRL